MPQKLREKHHIYIVSEPIPRWHFSMPEGGKVTGGPKSPSTAEGQMVAGASKNLPVGFLTRVPGQHLIMSEQQTGTREPHGIQRMT